MLSSPGTGQEEEKRGEGTDVVSSSAKNKKSVMNSNLCTFPAIFAPYHNWGNTYFAFDVLGAGEIWFYGTSSLAPFYLFDLQIQHQHTASLYDKCMKYQSNFG
jgi:hypothetical protein